MLLFGKEFICGASVIGPLHIKKGIANQDSFLCIKKWKYMLLVISDGMGSKPFAEVGSKSACEAVSVEIKMFVKNKKKSLPMPELFSNIVERWKHLVFPHDEKDCSATCLFVFVTRHKIFAARLGDGMICILGKDGEKSAVLSESKDENFSNVTQSLSDAVATNEFKYAFYDRREFKGIVLSTDGISSDMKNGKELSFASDLFTELKNMPSRKRNTFIHNMMDNWPVPHHTDDKTLVVAGL